MNKPHINTPKKTGQMIVPTFNQSARPPRIAHPLRQSRAAENEQPAGANSLKQLIRRVCNSQTAVHGFEQVKRKDHVELP